MLIPGDTKQFRAHESNGGLWFQVINEIVAQVVFHNWPSEKLSPPGIISPVAKSVIGIEIPSYMGSVTCGVRFILVGKEISSTIKDFSYTPIPRNSWHYRMVE